MILIFLKIFGNNLKIILNENLNYFYTFENLKQQF